MSFSQNNSLNNSGITVNNNDLQESTMVDSRGFYFFFWFLISLFIAGITFLKFSFDLPATSFPESTFKIVLIQDKAFMKSSNDRPIVLGDVLKPHDVVFTSGQMNISLFGDGILRIFPNTTFEMREAATDEHSRALSLFLQQGKIWVHSPSFSTHVRVMTNRMFVDGKSASFDIEYKDEAMSVYVYRHSVIFGFSKQPLGDLHYNVSQDENNVALRDFSSQDEEIPLLNSLLVLEGNTLTVQESQFDDRLQKLLLSKINKLFPAEYITEDNFRKDEWLVFNAQRDKRFDASFALQRYDFLGQRPYTFSFSLLEAGIGSDLYRILADFLVVQDTRRNQLFTQNLINLWIKIIKTYLDGRVEAADKLLPGFLALWNEIYQDAVLVRDQTRLAQLQNLVREEKEYLNFILPGDKLYPAKRTLQELFRTSFIDKNALEEKLLNLREKLYEVYDALFSHNTAAAEDSLINYSREVQKLLTNNDLSGLTSLLIEEHALVFSPLLRFSGFYNFGFYNFLSFLEQEILSSLSDNIMQDEYKISFVNDRIKVLSRLAVLVNEEAISLKRAIPLSQKLIADSVMYYSDIGIEIAAKPYFQERVNEFKLLFEFFQSPEYEGSHYIFDTHVYEEFVVSKKAYNELQTYLKTLERGSGDTLPLVNLDFVKKDILRTFEKEGFFVSDIESLGDPGQRLFSLDKIVYKGTYAFSANYDRDTQVVYEINLDDRFISSGKTLKNLVLLLETQPQAGQKDATESLRSLPQEDKENVTNMIETIALKTVRRHITDGGILVNQDTIKIVDLSANTFFVDSASDPINSRLIFSFAYSFESDQASAVTLQLPDASEKDIAGVYNLRELLEVVRKEFKNQ